MKYVRGIICWALFVMTVFISGDLFADVVIKLAVANSSDSEVKEVPIRYSLPSGIKRDDIVDTSGLSVEYDVDNSVYYVHGSVKLTPKEGKTLRIVLKDVWKIPESEISDIKSMIDDKITSIKDDDKKQKARLVGDTLKERLDKIYTKQAENADNIESRIQQYNIYREKIKAIKDDIFSLDSMPASKEEKGDAKGVITLTIEAENTISDKMDLPIKYYLPREIIPEYIIEKGDFAVRYDQERSQFFLEKEAKFEANEKKRFNIKIKDVWRVSEETLNSFIKESSDMNEKLSKSEYAAISSAIFAGIQKNVDRIRQTQEAAQSVVERIAAYRSNQQTIEQVKDDINKLHRLFTKQSESTESSRSKIKNVLREMQVLQQLKKLSDVLFKKKLRQVMIWKVIFTIVLFLIALTTFFYTVWYLNLKKEEKRQIGKTQIKPPDKI